MKKTGIINNTHITFNNVYTTMADSPFLLCGVFVFCRVYSSGLIRFQHTRKEKEIECERGRMEGHEVGRE